MCAAYIQEKYISTVNSRNLEGNGTYDGNNGTFERDSGIFNLKLSMRRIFFTLLR